MKRYGEKTLREALENGAILNVYDCPVRGPILRVKKDGENMGWITFDLYLKIHLDLEVVRKGEYSKDYTLKSIVYAELRKGLIPETTETAQAAEPADRDPNDFDEVCGVTVPRFVDVMSYEEIGETIERLKKAAASLEKEMEADNIPREDWLELNKEVIRVWEEIGALQYARILQGTGVDPSNRKFRDIEMGEVVTIDDVLHTWAAYKDIHEESPHFPQYLGNCQTYRGGTLAEIR